MKVILMEDVTTLGHRGEVREVATGYARNFLLPKRLAVPATEANLRNLDQLKRQRERTEIKVRAEAQATAARIAALGYTVTARASDDGRLFGSVSAQEIVAFLAGHGIATERRRVLLDEPIKTIGEFRVPIRLHGDVSAELAVSVVRE